MLTEAERASDEVGQLYQDLGGMTHYPGQRCETCQEVHPITEGGLCDECWVEIKFRAQEVG